MKETYYFPHDYSAHEDAKMIDLLSRCGLAGVGAYWTIIEILHQQPDGCISKFAFESMLKKLDYPDEHLFNETTNVCSTMIELKLIDIIDDRVTSHRVLGNKKHRQSVSVQRSIAGKASANKRLGTNVELYKGKERKGKEIKEETSGKPDLVGPINYLNEKAKTKFQTTSDATLKLIRARFQQGFSLEDFKKIIDKKCKDWLGNDKMHVYLRPSTLFSATNFENYLNEKDEPDDPTGLGEYIK